ncbi:hypothetical protein [Candidatus Lokiarchaeum ossiferum]|uniref:hypothetical protein n=1 Tax=Candidatus Lokiarchaeum ossiferum TaxID=2951803 RepID=UPI00352CCF44
MKDPITNDFVKKLWNILESYVSKGFKLIFRDELKFRGIRGVRPTQDKLKFNIGETHLSKYWRNELSVFEELKRIFYRISQKPTESYIPLWDLMDDRISRYVNQQNGVEFPKEQAYGILKALLYYTAEEIKFPIKYDPENAVFIKESDTFKLIEDLDSAFADWSYNSATKK